MMNSPQGARLHRQTLTVVPLMLGLITLAGLNLWRSSLPSPNSISQGLEFYKMSCAQCHGYDASGYNGPNLRKLNISDYRMATTIKKGVIGRMPAFGEKYNDQQIAELIDYLRTLQ